MPADHDQLLLETLAAHLDGSRVDGEVLDLGFAGVRIEVHVSQVQLVGSMWTASLFFRIYGGPLGEHPTFASMSGYGESEETAIVSGGCEWIQTFGNVLRVACTDADPGLASVSEITVDGRRFRLVTDQFDRALDMGEPDTETDVAHIHRARAHLHADPNFVAKVLESGTLPILAVSNATVLSVFVMEAVWNRTCEVKVNGCDWPAASMVLDDIPAFGKPGAVLMRELAVLVPLEPAPTTHAARSEPHPRRGCGPDRRRPASPRRLAGLWRPCRAPGRTSAEAGHRPIRVSREPTAAGLPQVHPVGPGRRRGARLRAPLPLHTRATQARARRSRV